MLSGDVHELTQTLQGSVNMSAAKESVAQAAN